MTPSYVLMYSGTGEAHFAANEAFRETFMTAARMRTCARVCMCGWVEWNGWTWGWDDCLGCLSVHDVICDLNSPEPVSKLILTLDTHIHIPPP